MKIALLTDGIFPYVIGGMQKHSYYLAKYFAKNKICVDLYHFNAGNEYDIAKLELFSEAEKKFIRPFVIKFPKHSKLPGHYIRESYEYSKRIFEVFQNNSNVDFIYAKGFSAWKLLEKKKKGTAFPPIGLNFHGLEMFQQTFSFRNKIEQWMLQKPVLFNLKATDYVFSYGGKISSILSELSISKYKIIESPTGIEPQWLTKNIIPSSQKLKFVFIGRNERRKGMKELVVVLNKLLGHNDFDFHFIGAIPETEKINAHRIIYHGQISDAEKIKNILSNADVLVCPSFSEGMPNVIMEAMAQGLAVIATDAGAVNLLVNKNTGWLIKAGNIHELENAMMNAINLSPEKLLQMKINAVEMVKNNFLWEKIILNLIDKISKAVRQD